MPRLDPHRTSALIRHRSNRCDRFMVTSHSGPDSILSLSRVRPCGARNLECFAAHPKAVPGLLTKACAPRVFPIPRARFAGPNERGEDPEATRSSRSDEVSGLLLKPVRRDDMYKTSKPSARSTEQDLRSRPREAQDGHACIQSTNPTRRASGPQRLRPVHHTRPPPLSPRSSTLRY